MTPYQYYLFDLDGTLIKSIDMIVKCFEHSLEHAAGIKVSEEKIRSNVGLPLKQQFEVYLGHLDDVDYTAIMKYHMDYQVEIWREHLHLYEGIREMLDELSSRGAGMSVVTSRRKETTILYTEGLDIRHYFSHLITPEDTESHKPLPGPAHKALELMEADPKTSLFIGDSRFDILCGGGAGLDTCFTTWGADDTLPAEVQATHTINHPSELPGLGPY